MVSLEGKACFVDSDCLEGHHVEHFIRKIAGKSVVRGGESVSVLVREIHHRNDFRWEYDLAVFADVPVLFSMGRPHAEMKASPYSEVDFAERCGEILRPPPTRYMRGIGPCLPGHFSRGIENSFDNQLIQGITFAF